MHTGGTLKVFYQAPLQAGVQVKLSGTSHGLGFQDRPGFEIQLGAVHTKSNN